MIYVHLLSIQEMSSGESISTLLSEYIKLTPTCNNCGLHFNGVFALRQHKRKCKSMARSIQCKHCLYTTRSESIMEKHVGSLHTAYKCDVCNHLYMSRRSLILHMLSKHATKGDEYPLGTLKLSSSPPVPSSPSISPFHSVPSSPPVPPVLPSPSIPSIPSYIDKNSDVIEEVYVDVPSLKCKLCNAVYKSRAVYGYHLFLHSKGELRVCEVCKYAFNTLDYSKHHH